MYIAYLAVLIAVSVTTRWAFEGWDYIETPGSYIDDAFNEPHNNNIQVQQYNEEKMKNQTATATQQVVSTKSQSVPVPDPKPIQTVPETETPCWRRCDHRINKIVYAQMPYFGAGVSDRGFTLGNLANLAGYLCATVDYPKPHIMLGTMHNNKQKISVNSTWTDYFNFTFYQDSSPAFYDLADHPEDPAVHRTINEMYVEEKYKDWLRVVTGRKNMILQQFERVEAFSRLQAPNSTTGFIWIIRPDWYSLIPTLQELIPSRRKKINYANVDELPEIVDGQGGCDYFDPHYLPDHMQTIFDQVLAEIRNANEPHAKLGFFHIRRGDSKAECNTTVPRMKQYIGCTFNGTQAKARNITLLLASDERDPEYRQAIKNIVEQDFEHIKLIDIDALVLKKVEESIAATGAPAWRLNNHYLFRLVSSFKWNQKYTLFTIEQRRDFACPHCTYLSLWKIWDS